MKRVKCKSGLIGSQERLQKRYSSFEDFEGWCELWDIAGRLGFESAEGAWEANQIIKSSVEPSDLEVVTEGKIDSHDIIKVSSELNFDLTDRQINRILSKYDHEQKNDPSATWNLVVENLVYEAVNSVD